MQREDPLASIIEREVELLGFELVRLDLFTRARRRIVRIFIDEPERGVTIDDCVAVTKALGLVLDGADLFTGPYNIEVSSPGADRPLVKPEHFKRFAGHGARIEYAAAEGLKQTVTGEIVGLRGDGVVVRAEGGEISIPFAGIIRANLHGESWPIDRKREPRRRAPRSD